MSEPVDITQKSSSMPRNSSILYRNEKDAPELKGHYRGLAKVDPAEAYWIRLWVRTVKGKRVLEIQFNPKRSE